MTDEVVSAMIAAVPVLATTITGFVLALKRVQRLDAGQRSLSATVDGERAMLEARVRLLERQLHELGVEPRHLPIRRGDLTAQSRRSVK